MCLLRCRRIDFYAPSTITADVTAGVLCSYHDVLLFEYNTNLISANPFLKTSHVNLGFSVIVGCERRPYFSQMSLKNNLNSSVITRAIRGPVYQLTCSSTFRRGGNAGKNEVNGLKRQSDLSKLHARCR